MSVPFSPTLVLGGGLAGAAAALTLARAGRSVTLVEREPVSKHKVCGEFLSAEALCLLQGLEIDLPPGEAKSIHTVRFASGRACAEAALPFAARSLTRCSLDSLLLHAAEEAGVLLLRGRTVEGMVPSAKGWQATLDSGERVSATQIVLATGKHDLRGYPRPAGVQNDLLAMKMYFQLHRSQAKALAGCVELLLHPGGYTGLQPVEEGANLTVLVRRSCYAKLGGWGGLLEEVCAGSRHAALRLEGARALLPRPLALGAIPYGFVRRDALGANLFAVGDQAAVIPSFTGDGMSIALYSGQMAAEAILQGKSAEAYQRELHRKVRWQVTRAAALSRALVAAPAQKLLAAAAEAWPGGLRTAARLTRLPGAALLHAS